MAVRTRVDSKVELLSRVPLFAACTDKELKAIGRLADEYRAEPGDVLVREGRPGRECFVIASGEAAVTLRGDELATLGPGSVFGEMSLIDHQPRSATVTALTPMTLLVITPGAFTAMLAEHATVMRKILAGMAGRLRRAEDAPVW